MEEELIARIRRLFPDPSFAIAIGDDASVFDVSSPAVATTDMLVEGVDFTDAIDPAFVGGKSLEVNLSDLAAMGAMPHAFLLSIGFPPRFVPLFDRFLDGLSRSASRSGIALIGGDLSQADRLVISITALGTIRPGSRPLLRSGARRGDRIFVSRPLGGSDAGLRLLEQGWRIDADGAATPPPERRSGYAEREFAASAMRRHVAPEAEVGLGTKLAAIAEVSACIDISDGLSIDLDRLCRASGKGAVVEAARLPRFLDLDALGPSLGLNARDSVLHGGEEFSLLFTASLTESELSAACGRPVYAIGRIVDEPGVVLRTPGGDEPLAPRGYDHFR